MPVAFREARARSRPHPRSTTTPCGRCSHSAAQRPCSMEICRQPTPPASWASCPASLRSISPAQTSDSSQDRSPITSPVTRAGSIATAAPARRAYRIGFAPAPAAQRVPSAKFATTSEVPRARLPPLLRPGDVTWRVVPPQRVRGAFFHASLRRPADASFREHPQRERRQPTGRHEERRHHHHAQRHGFASRCSDRRLRPARRWREDGRRGYSVSPSRSTREISPTDDTTCASSRVTTAPSKTQAAGSAHSTRATTATPPR